MHRPSPVPALLLGVLLPSACSVRAQSRALLTLEAFGCYRGVNYAEHGQPHAYDTNVPIRFCGAGIASARRAGKARVVEMARTLASWLGISPVEALDGRVLRLTP